MTLADMNHVANLVVLVVCTAVGVAFLVGGNLAGGEYKMPMLMMAEMAFSFLGGWSAKALVGGCGE